MKNEGRVVRIELTEEQRQKIKQASGEDISVIEFAVPEPEEQSATQSRSRRRSR